MSQKPVNLCRHVIRCKFADDNQKPNNVRCINKDRPLVRHFALGSPFVLLVLGAIFSGSSALVLTPLATLVSIIHLKQMRVVFCLRTQHIDLD